MVLLVIVRIVLIHRGLIYLIPLIPQTPGLAITTRPFVPINSRPPIHHRISTPLSIHNRIPSTTVHPSSCRQYRPYLTSPYHTIQPIRPTSHLHIIHIQLIHTLVYHKHGVRECEEGLRRRGDAVFTFLYLPLLCSARIECVWLFSLLFPSPSFSSLTLLNALFISSTLDALDA